VNNVDGGVAVCQGELGGIKEFGARALFVSPLAGLEPL
jgi:hypothetical protein